MKPYKLPFFILLGLFYSIVGHSQKYAFVDRAMYGLNGDVKSVTEYNFGVFDQNGEIQKADSGIISLKLLFNNEGHQTQKQLYDANGNIEDAYTFLYNKWGCIEKLRSNPSGETQKTIRRFDRDGNISQEREYRNKQLYNKVTYKYDPRNNLIEKASSSTEEGSSSDKSIYRYDKNNNRIEGTYVQMFGTTVTDIICDFYVYDDQNKVVEFLRFNNDTSIFIKRTYEYDTLGNLVCEDHLDASGNSITKFVYQYDLRKNKIETKEYRHGELATIEVGVYNKNGAYLGFKKSDSAGTLLFDTIKSVGDQLTTLGHDSAKKVETFEKFELDNQKNWVRKYSYYNGAPSQLIERVISYY